MSDDLQHPLRPKSKPPSIDTLVFITEDDFAFFKNWKTGLSLNFTLRNCHHNPITIYSIKLELVKYLDDKSKEFSVLIAEAPKPGVSLSMPIIVCGINVLLEPHTKKCRTRWTMWDDSAGSSGRLYYYGKEGAPFRKMRDMIKRINKLEKDIESSGCELLPEMLRFTQKPGEADSFHCQVRGSDEGIYTIRLLVEYHCLNQHLKIYSDKYYNFASIDHLGRVIAARSTS